MHPVCQSKCVELSRHFGTGSVRFVNSAFWGPCNQIAKIAGKGTVGFSDCTFVQWDRKKEGRHALQVESGSVLVLRVSACFVK